MGVMVIALKNWSLPGSVSCCHPQQADATERWTLKIGPCHLCILFRYAPAPQAEAGRSFLHYEVRRYCQSTSKVQAQVLQNFRVP